MNKKPNQIKMILRSCRGGSDFCRKTIPKSTATVNARSPLDLSLVLGTTKSLKLSVGLQFLLQLILKHYFAKLIVIVLGALTNLETKKNNNSNKKIKTLC